ncbi:MAG: PAS domain S-box protein, partial [Bacteroidetes bacterium]|nr:PAS domain S-box protein [Bacteroidota bacterium]
MSSNAVLLSLNQAFETMTGWKREDWIGKSYVELIHPEDRQKAAGTFRKTLDGELSGVMQYRVLTKGGEYRTGEFSSTRLVLEDGSPGVLGIARDVTAQIAVEDELRQAQKMESIGNLAGG